MLVEIPILAFGLVFVVLMMAFIINPPEAWIKRAFYGKAKAGANVKSRP